MERDGGIRHDDCALNETSHFEDELDTCTVMRFILAVISLRLFQSRWWWAKSGVVRRSVDLVMIYVALK